MTEACVIKTRPIRLEPIIVPSHNPVEGAPSGWLSLGNSCDRAAG
jgi:hypothetical protein